MQAEEHGTETATATLSIGIHSLIADFGRLASPLHVMSPDETLVPAIHVFLCRRARKQDVDARDTSAFTRVFDALCAGMTTDRLTQFDRKSP
jgi:hypothetical protein